MKHKTMFKEYEIQKIKEQIKILETARLPIATKLLFNYNDKNLEKAKETIKSIDNLINSIKRGAKEWK